MSTARINVRIPQPSDIGAAIRLYYSKTELSTNDIIELFGGIGRSRASKLKDIAREAMRGRETVIYNASCVNTEVAYEVWGLDIARLERSFKKLQTLDVKNT